MQLKMKEIDNLLGEPHYLEWIDALFANRHELTVGMVYETQPRTDKDNQGRQAPPRVVQRSPLVEDSEAVVQGDSMEVSRGDNRIREAPDTRMEPASMSAHTEEGEKEATVDQDIQLIEVTYR